jgi:hypothetical protein
MSNPLTKEQLLDALRKHKREVDEQNWKDTKQGCGCFSLIIAIPIIITAIIALILVIVSYCR